MKNGIRIGLLGWIAIGLPLFAIANEKCAPNDELYISVDTIREPLGVTGENRAQYIERVYGSWRMDDEDLIQIETMPAADERVARVVLLAPNDMLLESADIIVESRIEYLDASNHRTEIYGYRQIGRYPLQNDARNEISVPRKLFREPGSLIIVVLVRHKQDPRQRNALVRTVIVTPDLCLRRVYTHDRFTAIRLNRARVP